METKGLLKSKTFWSDVVTIGVALVTLSDHYFGTNLMNNPWFSHALWAAGILGIYGRKTADTKIEGVI
jgi:hypothetical protein